MSDSGMARPDPIKIGLALGLQHDIIVLLGT